jgi:hypothetical protein
MIDTRIETKHIIAELSVTEKVCLYNALYKDLASKGIGGDTELAHVNMAEMAVLRTMGGAGTLNPDTGLIQFMGGGGSPPPPPTNTTQSQTSEFPAELKPYIKDVLSKSQAIQEKRESEGYIPYEGPQIAEFTPEQEQAFTGIQGMVGQGQTYFDPSAQLAASSARAPTDQEISGYMSPYMQQVVDIQKREAERQGDVSQQQLATQAVGAGGFGGSRMAILEAEQNRNLQTQLGDIQARGTAAAYEDAQARLAAQRQRELAGSAQFMNLGTTAPQQQLKELTAVEAIGAQKQAQSQQALNIAKDAFGREQTFPEQTLQQYQSVIRGFPLDANLSRQTQTVTPAPSYLQQAAGLGGLAATTIGAFGGFGRAEGGLVSRMHGGPVDQNRGLGSIVVKRNTGQRVAGQPMFKSPPTFMDALGAGIPTNPDLDYSEIDKEREAYFSGIGDLRKRQAEQTPEEKAYLDSLRSKDFSKRREEIEKEREEAKESGTTNKYLAGMDFFSSLLSKGGEKSFLQNVGIAAGESNVTKKLMDAAKEEKKEVRLARKELMDISDQELANMAAVSGVTKQQKQAEVNAEIETLGDRIKKAELMQARKKEMANAEKEVRGEARDIAKILVDKATTEAALEKAKSKTKAADWNAVVQRTREAYNVVVDEKGNVLLNGKPITPEGRKMLNEGVKRAWDSYIAAGEGAEGFTAATNTFPDATTSTTPPPPPGFN